MSDSDALRLEVISDLRHVMVGPTSSGAANQLAPILARAILDGRVRHVTLAKPDSFQAFVEQMARFTLPGDEDEAMKERCVEAAVTMYDDTNAEVDDSDVIADADDEFLTSQTHAFWAMIRAARELLKAQEATSETPS